MAVRIIGLDIDGTLLTPERSISARTRAALLEAASQGVHIVPVTGRPLFGIPEALNDDLGIDYIISSNGASVWRGGELVLQHRFAPAVGGELLRALDGVYSMAEVFIDGIGYVSPKSLDFAVARYGSGPFLDYFMKSRRCVPDIYAHLAGVSGIEEIALMCRGEASCEKAAAALSCFPSLKYARPVSGYFEVVARDGGKGAALLKLGELLGVSADEIMAVGDSDNDVDMLSRVGVPVAMGNADDRLKDIAAFITADNSNDGVAVAVEKFVL